MVRDVLVGFVAAQHFGFLILEMFLWERPLGRRVFRQTAEAARVSATLAKNQGLYNGFLAAGLTWSLLHGEPAFAAELQVFFLGCVVVAGFFGAATISRRIFYVQAVPALVALAVTFI